MKRNGVFVGGIAVFAALLGPTAGTARADITYGITFANQLITIDTTTGAGAVVGNLDSSMAGYGLAVSNGKLYAYDQTADRIRQIDPATAHTLASINIGAGDLTGEGELTFRSDGIGFLSTASGPSGAGIYSFDLSVPSSTFLAASKIIDGLAFDSGGVLYALSQGISDTGSKLYTVNQTTGALSLVGALNTAAATTEILAGLTFGADGTLWGELSNGSTTSTLVNIDKTTGQATVVGDIGFSSVSGIAAVNPVPEPTGVVLLGTCMIGMLGLGWKRRSRAMLSR